ncbi:MAG: crossover junction endodeoxyribonuclease RuvC [Caldilineaceae bacterium]
MTRKRASSSTAIAVERVVLGIDPGTAITGYGIVAQTIEGNYTLLACGVLRTQAGHPMPLRLRELFHDMKTLIAEFEPDEMAIEKLFFGRNVTTAITVGQARGVILVAAAESELSVAEYTPAEVKQAITGYGNADKRQIQEMVQRLLELEQPPHPDDAADGVAVAICHLQRSRYLLLS